MDLPEVLIKKKRAGRCLSAEETAAFLQGFQHGKVQEPQMSAMLMAVFFQGLDSEELATWTRVMIESGETLPFDVPYCIDKHSTGGVGDKTSFIVAPIAAALGCHVPMLSGRGLGHTGGTLDKVETIPGLKVPQSAAEIVRLVQKHGLCFGGATQTICPLDRQLYALRDVTGTVESSDLIATSIMSKKLSEGIKGLVLDVKLGSGAFMKEIDDAHVLVAKMKHIADAYGTTFRGVVSDMSQPLGQYFGLRPEIFEAIQVLKGHGAEDLVSLSVQLAILMLIVSGQAQTESQARKGVEEVLASGKAFDKFCEIIAAQGGDISTFETPEFYVSSNFKRDVVANQDGYISAVDTERLGYLVIAGGGGRSHLNDDIANSVGAKIHVRVGDMINKGDVLLTWFLDRPAEKGFEDASLQCFEVSEVPPGDRPLVFEIF